MPPCPPSGALQALYRIFVLPTLPAPLSTLKPTSPGLRIIRPFSSHPSRLAKVRAPEIRAQKWNEEITSPQIYLVNHETGKLSRPQNRMNVMARLDTDTHRLVQLDERPDPNDPEGGMRHAVCKILGKKEMYQMERSRKAAQKEAKKASATASSLKTLELNWAIDGNDLGHRLDRLREFLTEGRKVEVVLAGKRAGRKASVGECEDVLARIRAAADEVPGAREAKALEGKVGGFCTVLFQGRSAQAQEKGGGARKMKAPEGSDG